MISYDEQEYLCKSGDTWESISKQFYMGQEYARALQRHNQQNARASDRMAQTGQIAAGERIFIPQSQILEMKYADAIVKPSRAAPPTTMPATFVTPGSSTSATPPPVPPNR